MPEISVLLFVLHCLIFIHVSDLVMLNETETLFDKLFLNYKKELRPVLNQSKPVHVRVTLGILSINDFDEISGTITLTVMFNSLWNEERFTWNPSDYGGLKSLTLPQESLWLPEMVLTTAADDTVHISTKGNFKVRVENTGEMSWWRIGIIRSACVADVTFFPFDIQQCHIVLSPFGYQTEEINFESTMNKISFERFTVNGHWKVKNSTVKIVSLPMAVDKGHTLDDRVCFVNFTLTIERKPVYFIVSVVTPIVLLALVNPGVFVLPVESGERVSFAITSLLSFAVFESMVSNYMPKASDPMSVLSFFLAIILLNSTLISIATIISLSMYHETDAKPVPIFLRKIAYYLDSNKMTLNKVSPATSTSDITIQPNTVVCVEKEDRMCETSDDDHTKTLQKEKRDLQHISWKTVTKVFDKILLWYFLFATMLLCVVFIACIIAGRIEN